MMTPRGTAKLPELARPVSSESGVVVALGRLNSSELSLILIS